MPFHIEISSLVNRARVLNLDEADLREKVLQPWTAGLRFEFGERDWDPRESRLTILEGPALDPGSHDNGWASALRAAKDVTRPMLEAAETSAPKQAALVIEADSLETALRELRGGRLPQQISWSSAVGRIESDPEVAAVILVVKRPGMSWPRL